MNPLEGPEAAPKRLSGALGATRHGVWILAEQESGLPARITFELLAAGRRLADALGQPLGALVAGAGVSPFASQLIALGADRVMVADHPSLTPESYEPYLELLASAQSALAPAWILAGHTRLGIELAGRLAVRLEAGLVTACTGFEVEGDTVVGWRPLPDGGMARVRPVGLPGIFTLRPSHHEWPAELPDRTGELVALEILAETLASRVKLLHSAPESRVPLGVADLVVAGGLGMGGPEHWHLLERLASMLGGALGASRGAVDARWRPDSELIGLSGHAICPRLYVAFGIKGSAEHMAGLRGAPWVIAINPDPAAPIMRRADLAIVADAHALLPVLIDTLGQAPHGSP